MASFSDPARRKKAADCSKRCLPSREKAFFSAAFLQRSSVKLFLKNLVIFSSCCDLSVGRGIIPFLYFHHRDVI